MSLLNIEHLELDMETIGGTVHAVRDISFAVEAGETVAIVGESGCGKTMTCNSIMKLFPNDAGKMSANTTIWFDGKQISSFSDKKMQKIRGAEIGIIVQDPVKSLNPTEKIGEQIMDIIQEHKKTTKKEAGNEALLLLEKVGISDSAQRMQQYPYQLSGGMRQRVVIAMAIACRPKLLIADEPTTALDVTIQAQILELLKELKKEYGMTILLVTHNLGVVASAADRVLVMYGGKIVEAGTATDIFYHPGHPYTKALLQMIPRTGQRQKRLNGIAGTPSNLYHPPRGCPFIARCSHRMVICNEEFPDRYEYEGHECSCFLHAPEYLRLKKELEVTL